MDYVVFGTGFGASVLVLGLLIREVGPRLRFRAPSDGGEVLHAEDLVAKIAWSRFCVALGSVLAIAGAIFLIATLVCILLMVSDGTGGWVMLGTLAVILLLLLYWTWAFFDRFGSYGILPERDEVIEEAPAQAIATVRPAASPTGPNPSTAGANATKPAPRQETAVPVGPPPPPDVSDEPEASEDTGTTEETPGEERLETPGERLAHAETPLEHGSAEADLDIAASTSQRPSSRTGSRPGEIPPETPVPEEDTPPTDDTPSDAEQPDDAPERNSKDT